MKEQYRRDAKSFAGDTPGTAGCKAFFALHCGQSHALLSSLIRSSTQYTLSAGALAKADPSCRSLQNVTLPRTASQKGRSVF